jgi:hypothetical protein
MLRKPSIALVAWLVFLPAYAADLTGIPRIVDGRIVAGWPGTARECV